MTFAAVRHGVAEHWARSTDPDQWLRAAQLEPSNADNWYRLGRYRQLDFEGSDINKAVSYYERATAIDPASPHYWMDLGSAYEAVGKPELAENAFRKAQQNYPISAEVSWAYGNFLLRQGRASDAFAQIHRALTANPSLTPLAVSICWRSSPDIDLILKSALPATPEVYWGAIRVFVDAQQAAPALEVWKRLIATHPSLSLPDAFPLTNLLIASQRADDAQIVWQQALLAAGIKPETPADGSLIWDGGFERDLLNGGFAWHYVPADGADVGFDEGTFHSGGRSLRIMFDGTANLAFRNIDQYVAVQPNTRYRLRAYVQTENLTTESGIMFQVYDGAPNGVGVKQSEALTGTHMWTPREIEFLTGPNTRIVQLLVIRNPSNMLANKIRGIGLDRRCFLDSNFQ